MKVKFSPVVGLGNEKLSYTFGQDKVVVKWNEEVDTFDFLGLPDGILNINSIETELGIQPIVSVERKDGVLYIKLINYIKTDAKYEDQFPQWKDVYELMN